MRKLRLRILISLNLFFVIIAFQNSNNPVSGKTSGEDLKNPETISSPDTAAFTELARLIAPDGLGDNGGDQLGRNVAISGNTAILGSAVHNVGANTDQGAAYVFVRSGTTWAFQQELVAPDGDFDRRFGNSVAISGDTALVGAYASNVGTTGSFQGAVYVFTRSGTTWAFQQKLVSGLTETNQLFGTNIAMTDNTAIISSPGDDIGANVNQGSAYIFTRSGSSWGFQARITAADGAASDAFGGDPAFGGDGRRVAISGDTVVVGAIGDNFSTIPGAAYVFTRSGTSWTQQQKLTAFDAQPDDQFGVSVDVSGNTLIVGADGDDQPSLPDDGSAYIYTRNGTTWTLQQKILGDGSAFGQDAFGFSVAISGDTAIVGAPGDDSTFSSQGAAFLFKRTGTTWTNRAKFVSNAAITPNSTNHLLGWSAALAGNTAIVGARQFTTENGFVGAGFVFDVAAPNPAFDFDADGRADVSVFRPSNGVWYLNQSSGGIAGFAFGQNGDKITPADFDGDGKTDFAVFRNGTWYLQRSTLGFTGIAFGDANDIPMPADYDGDGKADVAVFRPSTGVWYLNQSFAGFTGIQFGQNGDRPVAADYDGDGRSDIAVYRSGNWYLQRSSLGFAGISFGDVNDKPVPADYDGDGKADVAVFRPGNGTWYLQQSQAGVTGIAFGLGTDVPAPADFDGDGKADVAVFRPSNGGWYLNQSTSGLSSIQFGTNNDKPVPSAFVP